MVLMYFMKALPTLLTVLGLSYMGFLVIRNSRQLFGRLFLFFVTTDSLWLLAVTLIINSRYGTNIYLGRFAFAIVPVLLIAILSFTNELLKLRHGRLYGIAIFGGGAVVAFTTMFTSAYVRSVEVRRDVPHPVNGPLYPLFLLYVASAVTAYLYALIKRRRHLSGSANALARRQLNTVTAGIVTFMLTALCTNLLLPALIGNDWPAEFLPLASFVLAVSFVYAMSRYKLFDIRRAVVRSTTYVFLLATFAVAFVLVVDIAGSTINAFRYGGTAQRLFSTAVALAIAVAFQPLKRVYDKATNSFFFRDSYDPQEFFNELNEVLVKTADLKLLLTGTTAIIEDRLKPTYCVIVLAGSDIQHGEVVGTVNKNFAFRDLAEVHAKAKAEGRVYPNVLVAASLDTEDKALAKVLTHNDIGLMARLGGTNGTKELGHIILGGKKSGYAYTKQDIRIMGAVANELVIAIQNALRFEQIETFNTTLQQKIADATQRLRQSNEKLLLLDQTKDDFISMASHQLRTPLTSVKGYVSMVLDGDAGELTPLQRKLLNQSFVSAQRMVYLISDLLNVSRLRTGKFTVELVPTDLATLVGDEVSQLAETAQSRDIKFTYKKPQRFPVLMLDDTKIRQVIMNFLDNAIYYTPSGGHVDIVLANKSRSVELTVTDNGMGVPKSEQQHLFTKFYRARNARRARPDGTGLGLFMAKKVVVTLGGAIIFRSAEGKGSTFGFSFSKERLAQLAEKNKAADQSSSNDSTAAPK